MLISAESSSTAPVKSQPALIGHLFDGCLNALEMDEFFFSGPFWDCSFFEQFSGR